MENFNIEITEEQIMRQEKTSTITKSGMYHFTIKQARLKSSNSTSSKALALTLAINKDVQGVEYGVDIEVSMWFLNSTGNPIDFTIGKIGALLGLSGLPMKISSDCFESGTIRYEAYSQEEGGFKMVEEEGLIYKSLVGKSLWAIIDLTYREYNAKIQKDFSINSFYDDDLKSFTERKTGKSAGIWKDRLKASLKKEQDSFNAVKHLAITDNQPSNEKVTSGADFMKQISDVPSKKPVSINEMLDSGEEIPF